MMTVKTTMAAASISVTWKEERRETMHLIGTEKEFHPCGNSIRSKHSWQNQQQSIEVNENH